MNSQDQNDTFPQAGRDSMGDPRRWKALGVLAAIQFILVLDLTIVNVALPRIGRDLGFSESGLTWVVNGYGLMAGGLLLLGGRLGDLAGKRTVFLIGLCLFGLASLTCGLAVNPTIIVAGRFVQGVGEALAAPSAMGLIALMFTSPSERAKAVGIWGGLAGVGGTLGTVLSGVITMWTSWRVIFLLNVPVVLVVLLLAPRLIRAPQNGPRQLVRRFDALGAMTMTGASLLLVYGFQMAGTRPWLSGWVWGPVAGGLVLAAAFLLVENRSGQPLVPLSFMANPVRNMSAILSLLFAPAFLTLFFLMTMFLQQILHWSPVWAGLAYLPFGLAIGAGMGASSKLARAGLGGTFAVGLLLAAAGLAAISFISPDSSYWLGVLPGLLMIGVGSGVTLPTLGIAAVHEVSEQNAGFASGLQNTAYQLGGALGLAVLSSIALHAAASENSPGSSQAITNGYALAFRLCSVILALAAALAATVLRPSRVEVTSQNQEAVITGGSDARNA